MKLILSITLLLSLLTAGKYDKVKITPDMSYVLVYHKGHAVKIHRIQDVSNHLTGTYAKISYSCPGACIQPITINDKIETVGEVEVLRFIKNEVNQNQGVLIDSRPKKLYNQETIPSSINIPFSLYKDSKALKSIFTVLGVKKKSDGQLDTSRAITVMVYCNGPWCSKSQQLINALLKKGYPANKIKYYRGGFQMWKSLGLTTVKIK